MSIPVWLKVMFAATSFSLGQGVQDSIPPDLRACQRALDSGAVDQAIHLAQRFTWSHPHDHRGYLLLGDAYASQLPAGRFRALEAYRQAKRLSPRNPDPPYKMAQVALRLGGDDGERIMRENLERVIEIDPLYKDAWHEWLIAYRNSGGRREMIERLAPFAILGQVKIRIAQLLIEDQQYAQANDLLDSELATESGDAGLLALRAQSALESGDSLRGYLTYRQALAAAASDTADVLWHQVIGIATPGEVLSWRAGIPPAQKGAWLESFWARRNPNLFAGVNQRVIEHFLRFRYARVHFPLLHTLVLYQRSGVGRALNLEPSTGEREFHMRCESRAGLVSVSEPLPVMPGTGVQNVTELSMASGGSFAHLTQQERDNLQSIYRQRPAQYARILQTDPFAFAKTFFVPLNRDLRSVDSVAARVGYNLATGLDDRGIMYLRFGPPERVLYGGDNVIIPICNTTEVERWRYPGLGEVRFAKPNAFSRGERNVSEMVFRPMNDAQFAVMEQGLTSDAPSSIASLAFGVWLAQFRNVMDHHQTDLVVVATRGSLVAALIGGVGGQPASQQGVEGRNTITAQAGQYALLAHARVGQSLGRQQFRVTLKSFGGQQVSDMLLGLSWPAETLSRHEMIEHLQRDLTFSTGRVIRTYLELYGLRGDSGVARYHATYRLLRSDNPLQDIRRTEWPNARVIEFDREVAVQAGGSVVEFVDLKQALEPGRYLLRVAIHDSKGGSSVGSGTIAFMVK